MCHAEPVSASRVVCNKPMKRVQGKMLTEEFRKISKAADDFDYDNVVRILDEMVITFGLEDTDA